MRKFLVTAAIAVVAAVLLVAPAFAGKGGNGNGNGGGPGAGSNTPATVTASSNPATVGAPVYLAGCGYPVAPVVVQVVFPDGSFLTSPVGMSSSGCFGSVYFTPSQAGAYTVHVYEAGNVLDSKTWTLTASTSLSAR